jgi:hypothetical protein
MTDECSVCYEPSKSVLKCHTVCAGCTKLHFKQECPVCRKSHTLPVSGAPPVSLVDHTEEEEKKPEPRTLAEIYAFMRKKQKEQEKDVRDVQEDEGNATEGSSDDVDDCDSEGDDYDL